MQEISEGDIRRMVDRFYGRVREDELLGGVFEAAVAGSWPAHLEKMVQFWSKVLLGSGRYSGNPRAVHAGIPSIDERHFERWLALFAEVLDESFDAPVAERIHSRARAMASGLLAAINQRRDRLRP